MEASSRSKRGIKIAEGTAVGVNSRPNNPCEGHVGVRSAAAVRILNCRRHIVRVRQPRAE